MSDILELLAEHPAGRKVPADAFAPGSLVDAEEVHMLVPFWTARWRGLGFLNQCSALSALSFRNPRWGKGVAGGNVQEISLAWYLSICKPRGINNDVM